MQVEAMRAKVQEPQFGPIGRLAAPEIERVSNLLKRDEQERKGAFGLETPANRDHFAPLKTERAGSKKELPESFWRWRALPGDHALVKAWRDEKLDDGLFNAGNCYRVLYERANDCCGRDSTDRMGMGRPTHSGSYSLAAMGDGEAQIALGRIHRYLSRVDNIIVESFCGKGVKAVAALRAAVGNQFDERATWGRIREALGELIRAIDKARVTRPEGAPELVA